MPPPLVFDTSLRMSIGDLVQLAGSVCMDRVDGFNTPKLSAKFSFHVTPWCDMDPHCGAIPGREHHTPYSPTGVSGQREVRGWICQTCDLHCSLQVFISEAGLAASMVLVEAGRALRR